MSSEHLDVIVVGAGLSGIDAGYHLGKSLPKKIPLRSTASPPKESNCCCNACRSVTAKC